MRNPGYRENGRRGRPRLHPPTPFPKVEAIGLLRPFAAALGIATSDHAREALARPDLARAKPGFVDRLIHGQATASGAALVTFERAGARLPDTIVLE